MVNRDDIIPMYCTSLGAGSSGNQDQSKKPESRVKQRAVIIDSLWALTDLGWHYIPGELPLCYLHTFGSDLP